MQPSARATAYSAQFRTFMTDVVRPIEEELHGHGHEADRPRLDQHGRMHPEVWAARRAVQERSAAAGLYCPHLSTTAGGGGFSRVEMQHVEEAVYHEAGLGLGLAALAWTEGPNPALEHVSEAARERYLAPLVAGQMTAAFANTEPHVGSDVLAMETSARRSGSDWIINGTKAWITNAHFADVIQVVAVTEPGKGTRSLSMFLVDAAAPGFSRGADYPTILGDGLTGELEFRDVRVPAENVVGEPGDGFALAMTWINWRRLCRGGMCAGWGRWLLERALDRARARRSGGRPISELQAVQHMLADMDIDLFAARAASLVAQAELDEIGPFAIPLDHAAPRLISLVKTINDEAFFRVTDRAVQVHGAAGLKQGSPEEKLFRVARNLRIPAGTVEIQRNAIARSLLRDRASRHA